MAHYDVFADALALDGDEDGGDPVVTEARSAAAPRRVAPGAARPKPVVLLSMSEAEARLPDAVRALVAERLRGQFVEVRAYQPSGLR